MRNASNNASDSRRYGLTLIELLLVVAIVAILAAIAVVNYHQAQTRAKVSASLANLRSLRGAMELYRVDNGAYPAPAIDPLADPYGVVANTALRSLTTPISYLSGQAFADPFGSISFQSSVGGQDMFGAPIITFNPRRALLYFYYPSVAVLVAEPLLSREGYSFISVGPDEKDSFILYHPFPGLLPARAANFGVMDASDTVYDPTNGTISGGDIAAFGGDVGAPALVGGGDR